MKVASLTITNFEDFFYELTKGYAITSKRLSNIKSVLNGIMKRCVSREIIAHNILSDVDMQIFHKRCKPAENANRIRLKPSKIKAYKHLQTTL